MAFAWDIFAEEIGRVGQRAGARVAQRGIEKRAEERAYRMHEERLKIEEPFKELESERIVERQKELARERTELQKGLIEWQGQLGRELDIFAGSEGYQKAIETARKEGGLSQVAVMRMEDSIMRARRGELPDISDFEGLPPFDRLKIMDLLKQNQMIMTTTQQKQQDLDMEAIALQSEIETRGRGLVDVKRGLDITAKLATNVEDAEKEFHKHRSELMTELRDRDVIDNKGNFKVAWKKNPSLIDTKTGEIDQEVLGMLLEKYPVYALRFQRLIQLQGNVMRHHMIREQYTAEAPTEVSNTWTGFDGKTYEIGKTYTIGGQKVKCIGENQFEPVK